MTFNGNQQREATMPADGESTPLVSAPDNTWVDPEDGPAGELVEVDEILAGLADLDPADATGPAARVAELLGTALDREGH